MSTIDVLIPLAGAATLSGCGIEQILLSTFEGNSRSRSELIESFRPFGLSLLPVKMMSCLEAVYSSTPKASKKHGVAFEKDHAHS